MQANPFLVSKKSRPIVVGHRGVPSVHQENTLAGFRRAASLGIPAVELDVRLTRDGHAVVCHDEDLRRLTGEPSRVSKSTWDELSRLRIRKRLPMGVDHHGANVVIDYEVEERIPLLSEVFAELGGALLFNVELKLDTPAWSTRVATVAAREIEKHQLNSQVVVTSFDLRKLAATRRRAPEQPIGFCFDDGMLSVFGPVQTMLGPDRTNVFLRRALREHWSRFITETDVVGVEHTLVTAKNVAAMHERGVAVGAYTMFPVGSTTGKPISALASDRKEVERLVDLGVDWIETDDPERLQQLVT
jgi:glycerophosphoryl diester phosphodiesterase